MPAIAAHPVIAETLYQHYLNELLQGNRQACNGIVAELFAGGFDIRTIYLELLQRSMYEVGDLWEANRISVAKEHLATTVTEGVMAGMYPHIFSGSRLGRKGVISCVANEYHQIGGKMVADIFELNGWDGWFLGANTPDSELLSFIEEKNPDVLCLSLAITSNLPSLKTALGAVCSTFRFLDIFVGGQAFRWCSASSITVYPRVTHVPTIGRLEQMLTEGW